MRSHLQLAEQEHSQERFSLPITVTTHPQYSGCSSIVGSFPHPTEHKEGVNGRNSCLGCLFHELGGQGHSYFVFKDLFDKVKRGQMSTIKDPHSHAGCLPTPF